MLKVFIFYDSKYGNTKLAAEKIAEGLRSVQGIEVNTGHIREAKPQDAICHDLIVLGAPNHMARPSRSMQKFVDSLAIVDLKAKASAVFGTYSGRIRLQDRAEKKLESLVQTKLPALKMILPGLSVRVRGVTGPVVDEELIKCVDFGRRIATQLSSNVELVT